MKQAAHGVDMTEAAANEAIAAGTAFLTALKSARKK